MDVTIDYFTFRYATRQSNKYHLRSVFFRLKYYFRSSFNLNNLSSIRSTGWWVVSVSGFSFFRLSLLSLSLKFHNVNSAFSDLVS